MVESVCLRKNWQMVESVCLRKNWQMVESVCLRKNLVDFVSKKKLANGRKCVSAKKTS